MPSSTKMRVEMSAIDEGSHECQYNREEWMSITLLKTFIRMDKTKSTRIQIVPQLGSGAIELVKKHKLLENFVEDEEMIEYDWHC